MGANSTGIKITIGRFQPVPRGLQKTENQMKSSRVYLENAENRSYGQVCIFAHKKLCIDRHGSKLTMFKSFPNL